MNLLVLHNLKKAKGQFFSFGIVMLLTAVILNTSFVLLFQTSKAYDKCFDELDTADISVTVPSAAYYEGLAEEIGEINGIEKISENNALFAQAALQEFQGSEFTMNTYFYRIDDGRDLTKHTVTDTVNTEDKFIAYIPLYLSELGGYKPGENIRYIIDGKEYAFTVGGIVNEMQYGNYGTGVIGLYLSEDAYNSAEEDDSFTPVNEFLVKTSGGAELSDVKNSLKDHFSDKGIPALTILDREVSKKSRTMVADTVEAFLAVFALLVLLVSIFLARFKIGNTIEEEITEMGVLKGIGYTSGQLMLCLVVPYLMISAAGLVSGTALSYLIIPAAANILAVQSGFSYTPVFDIAAALLTIVTILVVVFVFTVLSAKKLKFLEPINAIRGIDPNKRARKNHFPLDTAKGPVVLNLIFKQTAGSAGRNILLFAVAFVMMILLNFSGALLYNVNARPMNFLTTLSEELPDIRVQSDDEHFENLKEIIKNDGVKAINYGVASAEYSDGTLPLIVCEDHLLLENNILFEGRHPEKANEAAIGSELAESYPIGSTFKISVGDKEYDYTVTGFIQSVNNNGIIAEVTDEGYENISDTPLYLLNLYLSGEAEIENYVHKLENEYGEYTVNVSNASKETESMRKMYSSLITAAAVLMFIITVLIMLLILYVIMNSVLTGMKTDFGIYKAVGFTSSQLIFRTVGSITPTVLLAGILSAVLGIAYLPVMFGGIFSVIGAVKNNFEIPVAVLFIMAILLTAVSILIGIMLCRPIKRITAYSLIKE
ncbi:MAG: ABC transporter permease [Ruminococcus sp.]|nr:ABC transporter permease [Ruminococcus sp.]